MRWDPNKQQQEDESALGEAPTRIGNYGPMLLSTLLAQRFPERSFIDTLGQVHFLARDATFTDERPARSRLTTQLAL